MLRCLTLNTQLLLRYTQPRSPPGLTSQSGHWSLAPPPLVARLSSFDPNVSETVQISRMFFFNSDEVINNNKPRERGSRQQGSYSRQVFLAVWVINAYVNTERGVPMQKCELSTSTMQAEAEAGGI